MQKKLVACRSSYCVTLFFLSVTLLFLFSSAYAKYTVVYPASQSAPKHSLSKNDDIWQVFREGLRLDHHANRTEVKEHIAWFMAHRKYLYSAAMNARPYMYYIVSQVKKRDLPLEFALLPFIESAYDPLAYSTSGASGLWQMMPATATDFGLKQNWWYDGRRDVIASTDAALDYLVYLQNFFGGNAIFTIAAYNAGQGTVLNAIKGNAFKGDATDFWSLPLSKQTQMYIPRLLALAEMIAHPEKYPLDMPEIPNRPYLTQVDVGSQIDLSKAAELSGLSLNQLKSLNPGFNRWATSPDGPYLLTVPVENAEELRNGLALLPQSHRVTWERYNVKAGDTLNSIAKKHDTSTAMLQQINKMDTSLLHIGDVIFIPKSSSAAHSSSVSSPALEVPPNEPVAVVHKAPVKTTSRQEENNADIVYIVRKGDTLTSVANALNVPWKILREYNQLSSPVLNIGQKLRIPPAQLKSKSRSSAASQKIRYTVQKSDTLSKIALRFSVSVEDIERWNPVLKTSPILQLNQKLVIYQS